MAPRDENRPLPQWNPHGTVREARGVNDLPIDHEDSHERHEAGPADSLALAALTALVAPAQATAQTTKDKLATLTVDNTRAEPVTVYVDQDAFDIRVGTVAAHEKSTLKLPGISTTARRSGCSSTPRVVRTWRRRT